MDFEELIRRNRSYRRFRQDETLTPKILRELANYVRLSPASGNIQGIKLFLSSNPADNARIFPFLRWAFYLKNWEGPAEGERPAAYMMILWDTAIRDILDADVGIAAQSVLLGAVSKGFGGCIIGSIDRVGLRKEFGIPDRYDIPVIIALGKPAESVTIEDLPEGGSVEYWRDGSGGHHVPKRSLEEIILSSF